MLNFSVVYLINSYNEKIIYRILNVLKNNFNNINIISKITIDINLLYLIFFRKRFFRSFKKIKILRLKKNEKKTEIFINNNDNLNALK